MSEELKPCLRCGSKDLEHSFGYDLVNPTESIFCNRGHMRYECDIEDWNARPEPDLITKILDAVELLHGWRPKAICKAYSHKRNLVAFMHHPSLDVTGIWYKTTDCKCWGDCEHMIQLGVNINNHFKNHDWTKPIYWEEYRI